MTPARPLDRYALIRDHSVDEMRAALARIYSEFTLIPESRAGTLDIAFNNYQLPHIGMTFLKYGSAARLDFPETEYISQLFPIKGKGETLNDGILVSMTEASSAVVSAGISFSGRYSDDYEQLVLRIRPAALTNLLSAITGAAIGGALRFDSAPDFTRPEARILRDHFLYLVNELSSAAAPLPSLLLAEFEQALMTMFLHANRHNYSHLLELEPPDAALSQVRRAEEYIEANWNQPISLETLAAITGVSARSLSRSFKQSRGYSPMQFVKQVRLRQKARH
jgi:hypothetical protein